MVCDDIQKKRVDDDSNDQVFDDFHRHDLLYKSFCLGHRAVGIFRLVVPCIPQRQNSIFFGACLL